MRAAGPAIKKVRDPFRQLTCASWLSVVESYLPTALVSARSLERLRTVVHRLPGDCPIVLETRLAAGSERVDLSLRLSDPASALSLVGRFANPGLERFLTHWSRREPDFAQVRSVWFELDLDRPSRGLPDPVICVELCDQAEPDWLLDVLLPTLEPRRPSVDRRRLIERCLEAVPAPGRLLYVFALGARAVDATRLELQGIETSAMAIYLEKLAPADSARRVADMVTLVSGCDDYHLSFDVGDEILPRIGLEASFRRLPHREPGWARLVSRLVARGLCTPEKRDALFTWPGWDSPRTAPDHWPADARRLGIFCARCLSHIKLVSRPDRELEAKAYLLFQPVDKNRP